MVVSVLPNTGGPFERLVPPNGDCKTKDNQPIVPTTAQLSCLALHYCQLYPSSACGGSDLVSRLTAVYGNISTSYATSIAFTSYAPSVRPVFINEILSSFGIAGNGTGEPIIAQCLFSWVSSVVLYPTSYIIGYNNPVCGSKAPAILDASELNRQTYLVAQVTSSQRVIFRNVNYVAIFSSLYEASAKKFSITITADSAFPSAENSCVYEYIAADRFSLIRDFTLVRYDLGGTPLLPGTNVEDGCIKNASTENLVLLFTNMSDVCGTSDPNSRFSRYFGPSQVRFYYVDVADGYFNITIEIPPSVGRRDSTVAIFHYADLSFPASTGSTIAVDVSTVSSTIIPNTQTLEEISTLPAFSASSLDMTSTMSSGYITTLTSEPTLLPSVSFASDSTTFATNVQTASSIISSSTTGKPAITLASTLPSKIPRSVSTETTDARTTFVASPTSLPIKPCNSILPADATNQCPPISKPSEDVTNILASVQIPSSNTVLPKYDGNVIQIIAKLNFKVPAALGNVDASKIGNSVFAVTESVTPGKPVAVAGPSIPAPNFGSSVSGLNALALLVTPSGYSASNFSTPSVYISADVNASVTVEVNLIRLFISYFDLYAIITSVWYAFDLKANGILTVIASTDKTPIATVVFSGSLPSSRKRADKGPTFAIVTAVAPVDLPGSNPATTLPVTSQIQVTSVTSSFGSLLSTVQSTTVFQSVSVTQAQQQSSQTLTSSSTTATSPSSVGATSTNTSVSVKQTTSVSTIEAVGSIKVSKTSSTSSIEAIKDISKTSGTSSIEANKTPQVSATSTSTTANVGAVRQTETINIKVNGVAARAVSIVLVIFAAMMV
ncbi:hypothetical protein HDU79_003386 [Rhizoclosmatium sp. JEL0117]|nr:hypothetical protein HDU79_003386 [Rhizoclosmatium sp. JEL0117]